MEYRDRKTGEIFSEGQLRDRERGQWSLPLVITEQVAGDIGYDEVSPTPSPAILPTQTLERDGAELVDGKWQAKWRVSDKSAEQLQMEAKTNVPRSVTMRQARLALLGVGLLGNVDAAIAALPSPQKEAAQIEWEYSGEVWRDKALVNTLGPALGLSEDQLDALFISAAVL